MKYELVFTEENHKKFVVRVEDNIKDIDRFTNEFTDLHDIADLFNDIYKKNVKLIAASVLLTNNDNRSRMLDVMYKEDKFDYDDIINTLREYLKKNPEQIDNFDLKFLISKFEETNRITDLNNIDLIINAYFKEANYLKYRDTYFKLKKLGLLRQKRKIISSVKRDDESISYFEYLESLGIDDPNLLEIIRNRDYARLKNEYPLGELLKYTVKDDNKPRGSR